jgi:hypothetical protein
VPRTAVVSVEKSAASNPVVPLAGEVRVADKGMGAGIDVPSPMLDET